MKQQIISVIDKYKHCLRLEASKKYLDGLDNAVVLGDAFIENTYILVFAIEENGGF